MAGSWRRLTSAREPISPFSELLYGPFYQERYHTCAAKHPCNMNGELFNATCGPNGNGFVDNLTAWTVLTATDGTAGGCRRHRQRNAVRGRNTGRLRPTCFRWRTRCGTRSWSNFVRTDQSKRLFDQWGQVRGYCDVDDVDLAEGQPFHGVTAFAIPYATADSNTRAPRVSRARDTTTTSRDGRGIGARFRAPPAARTACATRRLASAIASRVGAGSGASRCASRATHGTCQYDGTCLCDGTRRLQEGTYALRLTRDPFYIERGEHVYEVQGEKRSRYVHPVYMHTYDLEGLHLGAGVRVPEPRRVPRPHAGHAPADATQRDVLPVHHPQHHRGSQG